MVIGAILAAAAACFVAELLAFAATTLQPAPENLSLATLWDVRPRRWWSTPLFATAAALWFGQNVWTPKRLLDVIRGGESAGRATLGLVAWSAAAALFLAWLVFSADAKLALIMLGVVSAWLGAFLLHGWLKSSGAPDLVSIVFVAALIGVVLQLFTGPKPRMFDCASGEALKLRSGEEIACRSVDWLTDREAVLALRPDGTSWLVAKSDIDPAALIRTLGPGAVTLYPLIPSR